MFDERSSRQAAERFRRAIHSRRVVIALSALLVGLLVIAIPQLEAVRGELLVAVLSLGLALIGGTRRNGDSKETPDASEPFAGDPRDLLRELIEDALDDDRTPEK